MLPDTPQASANHSSPSKPPALRIEDLSYRYPDGRLALEGVNLEVDRGQKLAIIGPNGAGKSTLLWHLNGLLPGDRKRTAWHDHGLDSSNNAVDAMPEGPSVWVDGIAVMRSSCPSIRRSVGLLFQDPDDQLIRTTVLEDVAFGPLNQGLDREHARQLSFHCLQQVGLETEADRSPHHLSFGERKRVALAGVLACRPTILALDEPSANLDPRSRRGLISILRELAELTLIVATHDLELALDLCDRAILLDRGIVRADGPIRQLLDDEPLLCAHGLERPLSLQLGPGGGLTNLPG